MLDAALIILCLAMMLHFSRYWISITKQLAEERKDERIKSALDWKTLRRNPALGSVAPGSAMRGS